MAEIYISGNNIPNILDDLETKKQIALEALGMAAETYAKGNLESNPRRIDTGNLRGSIGHRTVGNTEYIGTNVEYAIYVELGTQKMTPSHYLKRSVAEHIDEYRSVIIEQMKD